jgi:hypothetical protein
VPVPINCATAYLDHKGRTIRIDFIIADDRGSL